MSEEVPPTGVRNLRAMFERTSGAVTEKVATGPLQQPAATELPEKIKPSLPPSHKVVPIQTNTQPAQSLNDIVETVPLSSLDMQDTSPQISAQNSASPEQGSSPMSKANMSSPKSSLHDVDARTTLSVPVSPFEFSQLPETVSPSHKSNSTAQETTERVNDIQEARPEKPKPQLPPRPSTQYAYQVREKKEPGERRRRPAPPVPQRTPAEAAVQRMKAEKEGTEATVERAAPPIIAQPYTQYDACFDAVKTSTSPPIVRSGTVYEVWMRSGLSRSELASIWKTVAGDDFSKEGLSSVQFTSGLRMIDAQLRREYILCNSHAGPTASAASAPSLPARNMV